MRLRFPALKWRRWHAALIVPAVLLTAGLVALGARSGDLRLPGVVETQEIRLASRVGGRVAEVAVAEGDEVIAGQVLVRFEAAELEARRDQQRATANQRKTKRRERSLASHAKS